MAGGYRQQPDEDREEYKSEDDDDVEEGPMIHLSPNLGFIQSIHVITVSVMLGFY